VVPDFQNIVTPSFSRIKQFKMNAPRCFKMAGMSPSDTVSHPRRLEFSAGDKSFRIGFLNISDERPKVKLFFWGLFTHPPL
jgi:hypothetical protein